MPSRHSAERALVTKCAERARAERALVTKCAERARAELALVTKCAERARAELAQCRAGTSRNPGAELAPWRGCSAERALNVPSWHVPSWHSAELAQRAGTKRAELAP